MNFAICGPCGGLVNHVRWITLMSNNFRFSRNKKLKFIETEVYPKHRTPYVWLSHEYHYRENFVIRKLILASHNINECLALPNPRKILILNVSPETSFFHYLKFNPALNGLVKQAIGNPTITISDIKCLYNIAITNDNEYNISSTKDQADALVLNIDCLYHNRDLDLEIYNKIIDFFEISNSYEDANKVYQLWFDLQVQGNTMMTSLPENSSDVENYWRLGHIDALTPQEYDIVKALVKNTYGE